MQYVGAPREKCVPGFQLVPITQIQETLEDKGLPCTFH